MKRIKKSLVIWFVTLIFCFVVSTFLHEMGHGISDYASGIHVSTGFNRVGQVYKKPTDVDFRKGFEKHENPWDMGPTTTLILAIGFTIVLTRTKGEDKKATIIVGAFALCNSLIRLIPMIHSYLGLLIKGSFYVEDEIDTGVIWYKLYGLEVMKYLPSLISIVISVVCLYYVIKILKEKLPNIFLGNIKFILILLSTYIISFIIENKLDNIIRINWI